jgi:hypothetical protein
MHPNDQGFETEGCQILFLKYFIFILLHLRFKLVESSDSVFARMLQRLSHE